MNDLIFVNTNMKLEDRKTERESYSFKDLSSNDKWIVKDNQIDDGQIGSILNKFGLIEDECDDPVVVNDSETRPAIASNNLEFTTLDFDFADSTNLDDLVYFILFIIITPSWASVQFVVCLLKTLSYDFLLWLCISIGLCVSETL